MLHIFNGDVTAALARRSGIAGEYLSYREALIAGPVFADPAAHEAVEARARFLSEAYGQHLLRVRNDLLEQERAFTRGLENDEVVLWFEHDLFCLIHFLALLSRFRKHPRLTTVWPSGRSLATLGSMTAEQFANLYESRAAVTPGMLRLAKRAWAAYTSEDPSVLNPLLKRDAAEFPFLRDGLLLHAARFPSVANGLGIIERTILFLIEAGAIDFVTLFDRLTDALPGLGFGDSEILRILRRLASGNVPLITLSEETGGGSPKALVALTPSSASVIPGTVDQFTINDTDEWLGGVHLSRENIWRWDEQSKQIVGSPPAGS